MLGLPRGSKSKWYTVRITETEPNTFELVVIDPKIVNLSQFNDLMVRVRESVDNEDQVSVVRWNECVRIVTNNIDKVIIELFSNNVRSKREGSQ
jgi:hypothetical protein